QPFITDAPQEVFKQLGITDDELKTWDSAYEQGVVSAGTMVQKGEPIFPRLDMEDEVKGIQEMMKKTKKEYKQDSEQTEDEKKNEQQEDEKEIVNFDDFMKLDLRVAEVVRCEKVENADKLLKLQVDLGKEKRQVISGIAEHYQPDELIGKKVICVTNLKPVKLRGEMSEGMILSGENPNNGKLSLATVDSSLPNGSVVE